MTDLENKVRAACADTTWGASGSDLMQIAQGTYSREDYALIMSVVWQRLGSSRWRCVYKALEVLKYLIMHGSSRCLEDARAAQHHIQTLEHYRFVDPYTHRDEGENVRTRARVVVAMIADQAVLDEEREKDKALRAKLGAGTRAFGGSQGGISSADYQYGARSGGGGGGGYGGQGPAVHTSYSGGGYGGGGGGRDSASGPGYSGYDDDTRGGYDDEPRGAFSALSRDAAAGGAASASMEQSVDDLLGGGGENGGASKGAAAEEVDDDDFNPRGAASGGGGGGGGAGSGGGVLDLESMLGGLDVGSNGAASSAPVMASAGSGGSSVPMSQLVQNLAAQKQAPVAQIEAPSGALPAGSASGSQPLDASIFDEAAPGAAAGSSPGGGAAKGEGRSAEPVALTRKEVDPFADLLSSAKGKGGAA